MAGNVRGEKVKIQVAGDGTTMSAYVAVPEGKGPFPAVIVYQEIFGVNSHIRDVTERVAREGYVAVAPDYHHRSAADEELPYTPEGMQKGMGRLGKMTEKGALADIDATMAYLRSRKDVRADRIGAMGFCAGGHMAYLTAATTGVRATASFYGGGIASGGWGGAKPPITKTSSIKGHILCFFGKKDPMISHDQVEAIRRAFAETGVRGEVYDYADASHAFFRDVDPHAYVKAAADDAWAKTKALFAAELKS